MRRLSIHPLIHPSIQPPIHQSTNPSTHPPIHPTIQPSVHPSNHNQSNHLLHCIMFFVLMLFAYNAFLSASLSPSSWQSSCTDHVQNFYHSTCLPWSPSVTLLKANSFLY